MRGKTGCEGEMANSKTETIFYDEKSAGKSISAVLISA